MRNIVTYKLNIVIYNKLSIILNIVTYKLLDRVTITVVRRQASVQVMGFNPTTFFAT
jgi:hypothetical protein